MGNCAEISTWNSIYYNYHMVVIVYFHVFLSWYSELYSRMKIDSALGRGLEHYMFSSGCMTVSSSGRNRRQPFRVQRQNTKTARRIWQFLYLCREEDSNLHGLLHLVLSQARLPITPSRRITVSMQVTNSLQELFRLYDISPPSKYRQPLAKLQVFASHTSFISACCPNSSVAKQHDSVFRALDEQCEGTVLGRIKNTKTLCAFVFFVRPPGLEPGTICLRGNCSTNWAMGGRIE